MTTSRNNDHDNHDDANNDKPDPSYVGTLAGPKIFPIPQLDQLVKRQFRATQSAPLAVKGRYQELLYPLVATVIAQPYEKAVSVIDFEGRFDPLRLLATPSFEDELWAQATSKRFVRRADLDHVHILRPPRGNAAHIAKCVASVEQYMLYGSHRSRTREWWGTIVIGVGSNPAGNLSADASAHIAVTAGWKGWLRVDDPDAAVFPPGTSIEDALKDRERRQSMVDAAEWVASCPWGGFTFSNSHRER